MGNGAILAIILVTTGSCSNTQVTKTTSPFATLNACYEALDHVQLKTGQGSGYAVCSIREEK